MFGKAFQSMDVSGKGIKIGVNYLGKKRLDDCWSRRPLFYWESEIFNSESS